MFKAMTALFLVIALSISALAAGSAAEDYSHAITLLIGNNQDKSDQDAALELLHSAAERGYAPGQTAMGAIYEEGVLRAQDIPQAILWYRKAAAQNDWIAQFSLGRIYFFGKGVARDTSEAKKWFTASSASGDSGSAFFLGLLNDRDQGACATTASIDGKRPRQYRRVCGTQASSGDTRQHSGPSPEWL